MALNPHHAPGGATPHLLLSSPPSVAVQGSPPPPPLAAHIPLAVDEQTAQQSPDQVVVHDYWVCCDKCDKWRLLTARSYDAVQTIDEVYCADLRGCHCDQPPDDAPGNAQYWSRRGGRELETIAKELDKLKREQQAAVELAAAAAAASNNSQKNNSATARAGKAHYMQPVAQQDLTHRGAALLSNMSAAAASEPQLKKQKLEMRAANETSGGSSAPKNNPAVVENKRKPSTSKSSSKDVHLHKNPSGQEQLDQDTTSVLPKQRRLANLASRLAALQRRTDEEARTNPEKHAKSRREQKDLQAVPYTSATQKELRQKLMQQSSGRSGVSEVRQWIVRKALKALRTFETEEFPHFVAKARGGGGNTSRTKADIERTGAGEEILGAGYLELLGDVLRLIAEHVREFSVVYESAIEKIHNCLLFLGVAGRVGSAEVVDKPENKTNEPTKLLPGEIDTCHAIVQHKIMLLREMLSTVIAT
ncbi:unnamed protein product [Amoebophrya sp. A120]|nr:unnamed protein product [Amoebophrya sp. A120]|eukprot:GSA120T00010905001.1